MAVIDVQELTGDQNTNDLYLVTPNEIIPDDLILSGTLLPLVGGLRLLLIGRDVANGEGVQIQELHGDDDTSSKYLVVSKEWFNIPAGATFEATLYPAPNGGVLVAIIPAIE